MRIYFAGPLFTTAERDFNTALGSRLRAGGHEVFLPQDQELNAYNPERIFRNDVDHVDWSTVVVGIMDGADPDSGTAWEIGYAYAKGTPIILLRTDFREWGGRTGDAPYNLMLTQSGDGARGGPTRRPSTRRLRLSSPLWRAWSRRPADAIPRDWGADTHRMSRRFTRTRLARPLQTHNSVDRVPRRAHKLHAVDTITLFPVSASFGRISASQTKATPLTITLTNLTDADTTLSVTEKRFNLADGALGATYGGARRAAHAPSGRLSGCSPQMSCSSGGGCSS